MLCHVLMESRKGQVEYITRKKERKAFIYKAFQLVAIVPHSLVVEFCLRHNIFEIYVKKFNSFVI